MTKLQDLRIETYKQKIRQEYANEILEHRGNIFEILNRSKIFDLHNVRNEYVNELTMLEHMFRYENPDRSGLRIYRKTGCGLLAVTDIPLGRFFSGRLFSRDNIELKVTVEFKDSLETLAQKLPTMIGIENQLHFRGYKRNEYFIPDGDKIIDLDYSIKFETKDQATSILRDIYEVLKDT